MTGPRDARILLTDADRTLMLVMREAAATVAQIKAATGFTAATIHRVLEDARDEGGPKQRSAADTSPEVALPSGGEGGAQTVPAAGSIPSDPIAASLWMRGFRRTGDALLQARLKPKNLGGASVSSASAPVAQKSSQPFKIGVVLHAPSIGDQHQ